MDLRQLTVLVAIADHGTFSAAARALHTVQSNVSSHVSRLEQDLGTVLVDRAQGVLTDDGALVVDRARRILRELHDLAADLARPDAALAGDVRVGVIGTTARWLMPLLLATLSERHPQVRVIVSEGSTSVLLPGVLSGRFGGTILHLPVDEPELILEPLFAEDLLLLVPAGHRLGGQPERSLAEFADEPMLLPPTGSALRRVLDRAAAAHRVTLRVKAEVDGVRLLASLALDAYGPTIVPATAVPKWVPDGFERVRVPELPQRVVALAHLRRPAPTAPTRAVFGVLREVIAAHATLQPGVRLGSHAFPLRTSL
jgi:molybdate transport repressor ModE-like protein